MTELKTFLRKSHNTTPGPFHMNSWKKLPKVSLQYLLQIFNKIWHSRNITDSWKQATIIPIPKFAKDTTNPTNYQPIALTSWIWKTLEWMINNKLKWFLKENKLITNLQTGFRKTRSTIGNPQRERLLPKRKHMTAIFFYIEKADNTTW